MQPFTSTGISNLLKLGCRRTEQQLVPWSQSRLVGAEGIQLNMYGSASLELNNEVEEFQLFVVVIDLLTSEAILGLDMLTTCIVDLSHRRLITSAGHEICLKGQNRCKGSVQRLHPLSLNQ